MSNENEQATPMTDAYGQNAFTKQEHLHGRIADLERQLAEAQRDLLTREEGGEWVSRCDHEDALAESRKDTERLDYLEENHEQFTLLIENHSGKMRYFDWWSDVSDWSDSLRQAIDTAMKEGE